MNKVAIGKRSILPTIRDIWPKEPEFSDWLAKEEGVELLTQDLGVEIENTRRELKGANFPCDIVANRVNDEKHIVVIENQFGRSDHDHLAKLLTYAAAHKAMTGIWICEEAKDDHRQVIDWLNENTPETVALYLVEAKAYTIGISPAALQLDAVCRPNVLIKPVKSDMTPGERSRREWRKDFWAAIHDQLKKNKSPFRVQRAGPDHWSSVSIGRTGFSVNMLLTPKNQSIAVELVIQPKGWKESAFEQLLSQKSAIEQEVGRKLDWREMPGQSSSRVLLEEKINPDETENRSKVCDWFSTWTPKVFLAFQDRVRTLASSGEQ